ncbi:MAG: hypothetical protein KJZ78_26360, partial [Bryobacteraceae bacterium]|nr:hypothetical protein [Bryobacteraceae bacterium]
MNRPCTVLVCVWICCLLASTATGAPIAKTGFESSEGYTGNDLMYEAALSDFGWASGWFHAQGGGPGNPADQNPWSVSADDGTAAEGDQYYRQHRFEAPANWPNAAAATDASTIAMHRLFPEQAGRLYLRFRVRVDTIRAAPQWFKNFCGFYLLGNLQDGNPGTGVALPAGVSTGPWVRFDRNGSLGVNQLGVWSVLPHKWDGTGALPSAVNGWVTLEADVDIASQTYELIYGGTSLGVFRFSSEDVDSLNGLRLQGPAAHDGNDSQPPDPINWRNGASFDDIFIGTSRATGTDCDTSVLPSGSRALSATAGEPASPSSVNYVIYNDSAVAHDYAIEPVLSDGTPTNYEWLSLSKSSVTLAAGASDSFTAAVDPLAPDPDLPGGIYTAYIKITDLTANCSDPEAPTEWIRSLVLTVSDWEVAPTILQSGYYHDELPLHLPEPIVYTVRNVGLASINYTAAESDIFGNALNYTWLTLNKAGGTVAPGSSDAVTVTIDPLAVGYGRNTGYVKFTRGAFTEIRKISFFRSGFGFVQI